MPLSRTDPTGAAPFLKRSLAIPAEHRGKTALITVDGDRRLVNVLINGRLVRRHHPMIGERWSLNLTPFVRFGEENEIELTKWEGSGGEGKSAAPGTGTVREVSLGFYDPDTFP